MPDSPAVPDAPRRWWQWFLMYPALGVALVGAVPKFYEWSVALRIGVSPGANVQDIEAQLKAWRRNADCDRESARLKPTAQTPYVIDIVSCPSGDILVTLTPLGSRPSSEPVSRWIITEELFAARGALNVLSSAAHAQTARPAAEPVPQRLLGIVTQGGTVTRRVQRSDGTCVDEKINAVTGRRVSVDSAPCDPIGGR